MQRKSRSVRGCVDFPVDDISWEMMDGGLSVKLVVCDSDAPEKAFLMCAVGFVHDTYQECLIGDDRCERPSYVETGDLISDLTNEANENESWQQRHFPNIHATQGIEGLISNPFLCSMVLGSTGWAGFREGEYWICTFDDLMPEGKSLYRAIEALYPNATLHLLTFLDT